MKFITAEQPHQYKNARAFVKVQSVAALCDNEVIASQCLTKCHWAPRCSLEGLLLPSRAWGRASSLNLHSSSPGCGSEPPNKPKLTWKLYWTLVLPLRCPSPIKSINKRVRSRNKPELSRTGYHIWGVINILENNPIRDKW